MTRLILILIASYLIGAIPFSFLVAKWLRGVDLRTVGSGNVGATNACRLFPKRWSFVAFLFCFTLDALKGFLPAFILAPLLAEGPLAGLSLPERSIVVGLAAILGHIYTPYLRFRGGKGVATSLGAFLAAAPLAVITTAVVGILVILVTRFVSVGSVVMSLLLPVMVAVLKPGEWLLLGLAVAVGAFIIYKHRTNLRRLCRGEEARLFSRKFDMSEDSHMESHP